MADELGSPNYLTPPAGAQLLAPTIAPIGSEAFRAADAFTAQHEGGYTADDGIGHAANGGVDQTAHPEVDVSTLNARQQQQIRYQYWQAVGGDALAQKDPKLALVTYDTAIGSGPRLATQLLQQSGGDAATMLQLRTNFMQGLAQQNPQKYGPVLQGWMNRQRDLAQTIGAPTQTQEAGAVGSPPEGTSLVKESANLVQAAFAPAANAKAKPTLGAAPIAALPLDPSKTLPPAAPVQPQSISDRYFELLKRPSATGAGA